MAPIVFEECVQCHRPRGPAPFSLRRLQRAFAAKDLRSRLAGWRATLERDPGDPKANVNLARLRRLKRLFDRGQAYVR